jgi:multimeric flavodoxin WrbA
MKDGLTPVLATLERATGIVLGSPIYVGDVTGALRSFLERYMFCHLAYDPGNPSVLKRGPGVGLVWTMNIPRESVSPFGYEAVFGLMEKVLGRLNPPFIERILSCDTMQFRDYGRFHAPLFDPERKRESREKSFPLDLEKARALGRRLGRVAEPQLPYKDA